MHNSETKHQPSKKSLQQKLLLFSQKSIYNKGKAIVGKSSVTQCSLQHLWRRDSWAIYFSNWLSKIKWRAVWRAYTVTGHGAKRDHHSTDKYVSVRRKNGASWKTSLPYVILINCLGPHIFKLDLFAVVTCFETERRVSEKLKLSKAKLFKTQAKTKLCSKKPKSDESSFGGSCFMGGETTKRSVQNLETQFNQKQSRQVVLYVLNFSCPSLAHDVEPIFEPLKQAYRTIILEDLVLILQLVLFTFFQNFWDKI